MPDMDRYSNAANRIPQGALCGDSQPNKQDNAASLLDQCHKYAATIGGNVTSIAHGAGGAVPSASEDCEQQSPSLINSLRLLRNHLSNIADESQRVRLLLGL